MEIFGLTLNAMACETRSQMLLLLLPPPPPLPSHRYSELAKGTDGQKHRIYLNWTRAFHFPLSLAPGVCLFLPVRLSVFLQLILSFTCWLSHFCMLCLLSLHIIKYRNQLNYHFTTTKNIVRRICLCARCY